MDTHLTKPMVNPAARAAIMTQVNAPSPFLMRNIVSTFSYSEYAISSSTPVLVKLSDISALRNSSKFDVK